MFWTKNQNFYSLSISISNRAFVIFKYSSSVSIPMNNLPNRFATTPVVPEPQNVSSTISPGYVDAWIIISNKYSGFCVGCFRAFLSAFCTHNIVSVK